MSGQPFNNPSDQDKYVNAYKANLKLRIKLNEDQLQASRLYKKTGEVSSVRTDNRTITEKLADISRIKFNLYTDLTKITTQDQIPLILQELNDEETIFLAQHIDEIASQIKPKYKLGIPAPTFVNYLKTYIDNAIQTNEINGGLQQTTLNNMVISLQQIQQNMINQEDLHRLSDFIAGQSSMIQSSSKAFITAKINELINLLPTPMDITQLNQIQNEEIKNIIQRELSEGIKDLPNKTDIKRYLISLTAAIGAHDKQQTAIILSKIADVLTANEATKELLMQAKEDIKDELKKEGIAARSFTNKIYLNLLKVVGQTASKQEAVISEQLKNLTDLSVKQKNQIIAQIISALRTNNIESQEQMDLLTQSIIDKVQQEGTATRAQVGVVHTNLIELSGKTKAAQEKMIKDFLDNLPEITKPQTAEITKAIIKEIEDGRLNTNTDFLTIFNQITQKIQDEGDISRAALLTLQARAAEAAEAKGPPSGPAAAAEEPPTAEARVMAEALPAPEDRNAERARKFMKTNYLSYDEITPSGPPSNRNNDAYIETILKSKLMRSINPEDPNISKTALLKQLTNYKGTGNINEGQYKKLIQELNRRIRGIAYTETDLQTATDQVGRTIGAGIKGKGIYKNKIIDETDFNKGIREGQKFNPFGRYYINSNRLNDNIISLRRNNGGNVVGFPNVKVSQNLANVFRTIVGKGKTNFSELEKLNDDEKEYLHKVSKHANIISRLDIPTPNKDKDEMEMNKFEIMKGEILSGNDNKDYIKSFKLQIVKLMKKELLPKDQALEILSDLAALGY